MSKKNEYPGYIAFSITNIEEKNIKKPLKKNTEMDKLKNIIILKEFDPRELPYAKTYEERDSKKTKKSHKVNHKRVAASLILLRTDHISPKKILERGGFQPHCLPKNKKNLDGNYPEAETEEEQEEINEDILSPTSHSHHSKNSGSVSCTYSMSSIKNLSFGYANYVYMVKAVGGFRGTNIRKRECEITVPGGIDAEDIIAFRRLNGRESNLFNPEEPLYINENFIRRYPDLLDYILTRYLEEGEYCPTAEKQIAALPGARARARAKVKTSLSDQASLPDIKKKVISILNQYISNIKFSFFGHHHGLRAKEVSAAISNAKNVDDIWYILNNQLELFNTPAKQQGTFSVPGLSPRFYSSSCLKNRTKGGYFSVISEALSIMPRVNILNSKLNKQQSREFYS